MSTAVDRDLVASLAADQLHVQGLLADLAAELLRVPVEESTRTLHLRALALRRVVMRWPEDHPDEQNRRAVCNEVIALQEEARARRRLLATERQMNGRNYG